MDSKGFWKTMRPFLSDKSTVFSQISIEKKLPNHPSVQAIKDNSSVNQDFYFPNTEVRNILKETTALNNKKMISLVILQQNL